MKLFNFSNPKSLQLYTKTELIGLASEIRDFLIRNLRLTGGHLASNLGVVELTLALYKIFQAPDEIFFDTGHQSYVQKIITGRAEKFSQLFKTNGLSAFQSFKESRYDYYEGGHAGNALSVALGKAFLRDQRAQKFVIVPVVGDASLVSGLSLEALNHLGAVSSKIIIIVNDNKMSIQPTQGGVAKVWNDNAKSAKMFFESFNLAYLGPVSGHDFDHLFPILKTAQKRERTVVVHVQTIKGQGYSPSANDHQGHYHSVTPNFRQQKMSKSNLLSQTLKRCLQNNPESMVICASTVIGAGLHNLQQEFPKQFQDPGIAEEHAISLAGGFALGGGKPIVVIYSSFLQRSYDQLHHDLGRLKLGVKIICIRHGLNASQGASHHGIYDVAFAKTIPNLEIFSAYGSLGLRQILEDKQLSSKLILIRYNEQNFEGQKIPNYQKWFVVSGDLATCQVAIITHSRSTFELFSYFKKHSLAKAALIHVTNLKKIDEVLIKSLIKRNVWVLFYEEVVVNNSYSSLVLAKFSFYKNRILTFILPNEFISFGNRADLLRKYNLGYDELLKVVKNLLNE